MERQSGHEHIREHAQARRDNEFDSPCRHCAATVRAVVAPDTYTYLSGGGAAASASFHPIAYGSLRSYRKSFGLTYQADVPGLLQERRKKYPSSYCRNAKHQPSLEKKKASPMVDPGKSSAKCPVQLSTGINLCRVFWGKKTPGAEWLYLALLPYCECSRGFQRWRSCELINDRSYTLSSLPRAFPCPGSVGPRLAESSSLRSKILLTKRPSSGRHESQTSQNFGAALAVFFFFFCMSLRFVSCSIVSAAG